MAPRVPIACGSRRSELFREKPRWFLAQILKDSQNLRANIGLRPQVMVRAPQRIDQPRHRAHIRQAQAAIICSVASQATMAPAREARGHVFAERESGDGDHANVRGQAQLEIQGTAGAVEEFAKKANALA